MPPCHESPKIKKVLLVFQVLLLILRGKKIPHASRSYPAYLLGSRRIPGGLTMRFLQTPTPLPGPSQAQFIGLPVPACPPCNFLVFMSRYLLARVLFLWVGVACCGAMARGAEAQPVDKGEEIATTAGAHCLTTAADKGLRVVIFSDSMGLAGFAEELDACFRSCAGVASVHTLVACGTNPLSWMKAAPYAKATTRCGFLRIETAAGKKKPDKEMDVYGMTKGHKPAPHTVPKIEDLLERINPDIVVFQSGNNFFDFFKQGRIIKEESDGKLIRAHVAPLIRWLATNASSVRKFYWVAPPQAGNVTPEVQQFVFDSINSEVSHIGVMLDSRKITSFPYKVQQKDKMHFGGKAALDWGDDIFRLIAEDLVANDINAALVLTKRDIYVEVPVAAVAKAGGIVLRLRLKAQTKVPVPASFAPYGEFLVGFLYDVVEVRGGKYDDKQLLVMHPAYIKHEKQDLSRFQIGKEYELSVSEILEDSLWAPVHRRDDVGDPELFPYMLNDDMVRHPDCSGCPGSAPKKVSK